MQALFELPPPTLLPIDGEDAAYPVGRIFCVGRNYVAHAAEMGGEVDREAPWYFTKSPSAAVLSPVTVPYPPGTENYHHEMELAFAIGAKVFEADERDAAQAIFGYAAAFDMTRRDLQQVAKDNRRPWSLAKDVEAGAVLGHLTRAKTVGPIGAQRIRLWVGDDLRQDATLADMVWSPVEIVQHLSRYYHLRPGDLVLTGTPAGVGPVEAGETVRGEIDGLAPITLTLT